MIDHLLVILQGIAAHGVGGALVVALMEKLVPIVPAIVLYGLIGASAAEGSTPVAFLVIATALGSCAGSALWYIGMRRATSQFRMAMHNRFGSRATGVSRGVSAAGGTVRGSALAQIVPGVRFAVALFAVDGQPVLRFAIGTFIGALVWSTIFLGLGMHLGHVLLH